MELEYPEKIRGESAREYIIRLLRLNILNLNLKPGQPISENEVGEALKTSRTPVREAFIKLSEDHLIEIYPQKGTYVSKIKFAFVEEGWFARMTLEKAIAKLLCAQDSLDALMSRLEENLHMQEYHTKLGDYLKFLNMDEAFHRHLYKACGKERVFNAIEGLNNDFYRLRFLSLSSVVKLEALLAQHNEIKNAIKSRDSLKAEKAVENHLLSVKLDEAFIRREYPHYLSE